MTKGREQTAEAGCKGKPPPVNKAANKAGPKAVMPGRGLKPAVYVIFIAVLLGLLAGGYWYFNRDVEPRELTIGAGPFGSDSYDLMREVAEVVERHSDVVRLKIVGTKDSSENISRLNTKELDLATIRSDTPVVNDVRLVADLFPDYFQLIVRADSGILSPESMIGKRIFIPRFGTDEFRSFWVLADHYDLPVHAMRWKATYFANAAEALLAGEIDGVFTVRSLRDRRLLRLFEDASLKSLSLRYVTIAQAEAIAVKRPFLEVGRIPKGAFGGGSTVPRRDTITPLADRVLVTHEGVDASLIREVTRILFEHRLDLVIRFALASAITKPDTSTGVSVPLHEGAEQYFNRDQPSFIQENAEPLALMVTVAAMLISGLLALRSRLVSTQKNRMDSYNHVLLDTAARARATSDAGEIRELKHEMFNILERVVYALDTDDVTEEGFQSFSLLWETVNDFLNERLREMGNDGSSETRAATDIPGRAA